MNLHLPKDLAPNQVPPWSVLQAPPEWRQIDFISDLHLQASDIATFELWRSYMQRTPADALFILGDLFEVWPGDDVAPSLTPGTEPLGFEALCGQVIRAATERLTIHFIHGNRDFLLGQDFARRCAMGLLTDPTVLLFADKRWLLSHGDALCLDDTDYMQFRAKVRTTAWQDEILKKPLSQRQALARTLRNDSDMRKGNGVTTADLDTPATCRWMAETQTTTLIHGHTHRPADHVLPDNKNRIVLSDWDASALHARSEVLRLSVNPSHQVLLQRLSVSQAIA